MNEPPVTHSQPSGAATGRELTQDELIKLPMQALLVRLGRMSLDQLADALRENVATGVPVEQIAVQRGWVEAAEVEHLRSTKRALGAPVDDPPATAAAPVAAPATAVAPVAPAAAAPIPGVAPAPPPAVTTVAPEPASMPAPVANAAPPAPAPVVPAAQPAPQPAQPASNGAPAPAGDDDSAAVFVALTGGQRVRVSAFGSMDVCRQRADEVMDLFNRPEPGVWPRFGNRLVRPDAVTSIEISRRRDD